MNDETRAVIQETVDQTLIKIKKAGLLKDDEKPAFKKTEELLKTYKELKTIEPDPESMSGKMLRKLEEALDSLQDDDYSGLVEMIYFDGATREECAEFYGVEPITITRNKKRLVETLKNIIFTDDVIRELFL